MSLLDFRGSVASILGETEQPACKPGTKSEHDKGVAFFAPWEDPFSGFPEHARRLALAIHQAGMPLHLRSNNPTIQWEQGEEREALKTKYQKLLTASVSQYMAQIYMMVSDRQAFLNMVTHPHLDPDQLAIVNRYKVLSTVWERQFVGKDFARAMNMLGQVWVSCRDNRDMLVRCGLDEKRVHLMRLPHFPDDPCLAMRGKPRMPGPVKFYHIGKWEPRKAQDNILKAFMLAFQPGEAILTMKTSERSPQGTKYPVTPDHAVFAALDDQRVRAQGWTKENLGAWLKIRRATLSSSQILQMHKNFDVYVTLSRGEGVDMPALDAKLAGNLMVYVPSGGPQDYASPADVCVATTGTVPCDPFYRWEKEATYYDYDLEAAMVALRVANDKVQRARAGKSDAEDWVPDLSEWTAEAVGTKAKELIEAL